MFKKELFIELLLIPLKLIFRDNLNSSNNLSNPNKIAIIYPHFKLGILFSSSLLIRSIKEKYSNSVITLFVKDDHVKLLNNDAMLELLGLSKIDRILSVKNPARFFTSKFDVAIVPTFEKFSLLSHLIMRFSQSETRIGISKMGSKTNPYSFLFDRKIELSCKNYLDTHITEVFEVLLKSLEIYQPINLFGYNNYKISDSEKKEIYVKTGIKENQKIILLNNVPEIIQNKWGAENLVILISLLVETGEYFFFYIEEEIKHGIKNMLESEVEILHYIKKDSYEELLKIFSICDLVITCDSAIMHFAGLINVPQISIFGLSNPFSLAPLGPNKKFIKKSDLINDTTGKHVFELSQELLKRKKNDE